MLPLRAKISRIGGSACLSIPLTLAKMYQWAPGAVVRAKIVVGGAYFEKEVRSLFGGRASGIIIPKPVMEAHGLDYGSEVRVPYFEWVTVTPVAWPDDEDAEPSNRPGPVKAAARKKAAAKAR